VIIAEFTDNKCLALKPASCEVRHEVEVLTQCVGKGRGSSEFAGPQSLILSKRPIKTTAHKILGYVPHKTLNPSQTPALATGVRLMPLSCWRNGRMGWMTTPVFGCTQGLTTNTGNAYPILKHKKTPRPCISREGACRKAQKASWRSWSCWWYAPPQVRPHFSWTSAPGADR
jgi:hypothetical protein